MSLVDGYIRASALQVRRAYESHFKRPIPGDVPYAEIARELIRELGIDKAKPLIEGQSTDPNVPEATIAEQSQ